MKLFSLTHILFLTLTIVFLVLTSWAVRKMSRKWQNFMFILSAFLCAGGIFFQFAMGLSFTDGIRLKPLLLQLMQVCNFNFLILPLCLVPKFKFLRQYAIFFSMFAVLTTLVWPNGDWANLPWNDIRIINPWLNHTFGVACPLWMMVSGRERPVRKYVLPTAIAVCVYFTLVYVITEILLKAGVVPAGTSFSFVHEAQGIPLLGPLREAIGLPYFYLFPVIPLLVAYLYMFESLFVRPLNLLYHGGDATVRRLFIPVGETIRLPKDEIAMDDHVFLGFSDSPDAVTADYPPGAIFVMPARCVTLHAVWKKEE